jgi:iron complex outermembrane receptor protein
MNAFHKAALAASGLLSMPCAAQQADGTVDEVIVVGRSVATGTSIVEVERELLVDTAAVLKDIPGANVNMNGPITGIAQYRGMYGDRVAISIDSLGVISGGPNAMDAPLSYSSPMMTSELVLSRGITSVSAAPESIGGHISTTTDRGDFGGDGFGLSGRVGSRFADNGSVTTSVGRLTLADSSHRVSLIAELDDGDDIETPKGDIRPTSLNRERYDASYSYQGGTTRLMLYAGRLDTTDTGTPALPMDIVLIDTELYGAQLSTEINPGFRIEGRIGYNSVEHEMNNFSLREPPMAPMYRVNNATGDGALFSVSGVLERSGSELRIGVDGIGAEHDAVITNPNNAAFRVDNFAAVGRDVLGAFAEWRRSVNRGDWEIGVRFNRVEAQAGEVGAQGMMPPMGDNVQLLADAFNSADRDLDWDTFDAVVKYRRPFAERAEWSIELGSKSRAPSYQELYLWLPLQSTGGLADGRTYIGNLDLEAERSSEIVVGLTARSGRFGFSPQVFYRDVKDYIQGIPSTNMVANMVSVMMSGAPALEFENVEAHIWGMDLAWNYELADAWALDGSISAMRGSRTDVSDNLYRMSPYNGSLGLTYKADSWNVKGEIIAYADQDLVSAYNDEQRTDGYWLANIGFTWHPVGALRVEARVDNLLDESYQDHLAGINRAAGSDIPVGTRLYGAGRTLSAGLVYSF